MTAQLPADAMKIAQFRKEFLEDLPELGRAYRETALAEGTTAAMEKVMNTALKVIEGLEVEKKKDVYANLPVIHVSFGPGMLATTTVEPAPQPTADTTDVVDVEPKSPFKDSSSREFNTLPEDVTELLPAPESAEDAAILEALSLGSSAMALD